jgi:hypothetical protein
VIPLASYPRTAPLLRGDDPAPGESAAITAVIDRLRRVSATAGDAVVLLGRIGADVTLWTGPAADACDERRDELVRRLQAAQSAYTLAADALVTWLDKLASLQLEAAQIAREAVDLQRSAQDGGTLSVFASPGAPAVPGLAALQRRHDEVAERATAAARDCAGKLGRATDIVERFKHSAWQNAGDFLHGANEVLGTAVLVLTIAAVIPPLAPVAVPALAFAKLTLLAVDVTKLGVDLKLVSDGDKGWGTIGKDAVDLATGGAGTGFGGMAKAARAESQLRAGAAAADDAADASRFASRAGAAADDLAGGFTGAVRREILHPFATVKNDLQTAEVVKDARAYAKLPPFDQWLPPGHRGSAFASTAVQIYEANEVRENVSQWIRGDKR